MAAPSAKSSAVRTPSVRSASKQPSSKISKLTGELLSQSWKYLIPSFGLTLIYINIHFAGRYMAHSRHFSDFGKSLKFGGGSATKNIPGGKGMEYAELIILFLLDGLLASAIILVAFLITLILRALMNQLEFLKMVGMTVFDSIF